MEIDKASRIVVPKKLRDALHLTPGTQLKVERNGNTLVLEPDFPEARLAIEDGLPLICAVGAEKAPVHDLQVFTDLIDRVRAERDRHNSGLYDDEIDG